MNTSITVIHERCNLDKDNNIKLPYTAYIIEYEYEGNVVHDIAVAQKAVDIFDHYYDTYKEGFKWLKQSKGTLRPNLWQNPNAQPPKRRKKKRSSAEGEAR
tara:strand:- start:1216 stop:1518 length:303 start_codon:yes stop_codon:yes gene_type:complete